MRQTPLEAKLTPIIAPIVEEMGFRFMTLSFAKDILQIMAENPETGSLGVEDCAKISRAIAPALDVEDLISGAYRLEVSSPGIDRPLVDAQDFRRYAGFEAKIELGVPAESGQKRFRGILGDEKDGTVLLKTDEGDKTFPLADIQKARLVMNDSLLQMKNKKIEKGKGKGR
ncbi:MAG: ribosome maturation factor RimP [Rhodospirillales bacterium]|nr:ribosome maturation factor RimP [Alphaproteobacteria bacterium]USO03389.1 MAG: ribosome maturation factor RimP [Rhodospirillales bacterium]